MWPFRSRKSTEPKDYLSTSPRGLLIFAITLSLFYAAISWLSADPRFSSAIQLTAALRYVLTEGALDASPEMVFQAAANGLTAPLDPFSSFMPSEELGYFEEETEGEYVGIGVEIKSAAGAIVVVRVLPQTSASDAMIEPGDRIVAINDAPITGYALLRVVDLMRGAEGTTVMLRVMSPNGMERQLTLERRAVTVSPFPIHGIALSGAAYIRWTDFSTGSADRLAAIIEAMTVGVPSGLILDLRGNPGGLLEEAVSAAGIFLPQDALVCRVIARGGREVVEYRTYKAPATYTGPVVVVVDQGSASASEVLAAALQESGRAVIVGRRTFGKGWVQNIFPLEDGSALRLSTARYYTPSGHTFGDPTARYPENDLAEHDLDETVTSIDTTWFAPSGLVPDTIVDMTPVGPWEELFGTRGVFADFVIASGEEWPAEELTDRLRRWADSLGLAPKGLAGDIDDIAAVDSALPGTARAKVWENVRRALDSAYVFDRELLFERETAALRFRLWEERILSLERPDAAELEEYLSVDPDLSAARELLEDKQRYIDLTRRRMDGSTARIQSPR